METGTNITSVGGDDAIRQLPLVYVFLNNTGGGN